MSARQTTLMGMNRARTPAAALFRRVFLINGMIFTLGTLILALSPATVSARIKLTEIPVLVVGLAVILTANALLLRSSLAPWIGSPRRCGESIRPSAATEWTTATPATCTT
jgi:hypothetical protein